MSIDTHVHLFHRGLPRAARRRHDPAYDATLPALRAIAAPCGVDRFVVVQPSFLGSDNHHLLEQLAADPERLRGVAVLDPATPGSAIDALRRLGVAGIRLNLLGTDLDESLSPAQLALVERCAASGLSVELHDDCERLLVVLPLVLARCPVVVVDHFGRPAAAAGGIAAPSFLALLRLAAAYRVYVKLAAPYRSPGLEAPAACAVLQQALGRDRLLWGSDWPWTQHERATDYPACCRVDDPAGNLPAALTPNAATLYGFPPP